jgi:release factor glutamine methyltransferase
VFAEDEARLLIESSTSPAELEQRVRRREAGEPLEVIVGWADFCGLRVAVDPGVFVPRQRSALVVDVAAAGLPAGRRALVLDLCCGTGALGLALASRAEVDLVATEVDPAAVACARRNLAGVGEVFAGDLFDPLPASLRFRVDVILANAPYVPTAEIALMPPEARLHEPRSALDGGDDGLAIHRRIAAAASDWLAPGGRLLIEVAERQVDQACRLLRGGGLRVEVHRDDERDAIAVVGVGG